jgi:restriction endonuclease
MRAWLASGFMSYSILSYWTVIEMRIKFETMYPEQIRAGELRAKYSAAGDRILRYYIDFLHTALELHKELSATELSILQNKVDALMASWDTKYESLVAKKCLAGGKDLAEQLTAEAEGRRDALHDILRHTLTINDAVKWDVLKDRSRYKVDVFREHRPSEHHKPGMPHPPAIGFFQRILGQKKRIEREYKSIAEAWEKSVSDTKERHKLAVEAWGARKDDWEAEQEGNRRLFEAAQTFDNARVDELQESWRAGAAEAILEHAGIVLEASQYDDLISKEFRLQYEADSKTLLVEYHLPSPDDLPLIKTVRFVAKTGELKETQISAKDQKTLFDGICYQLCLRTLHELFEADTAMNIEAIVFNGMVKYVDRATGQDVQATIMSLMAGRDEFLAVNLSRIEAKACFKSLKGISASSLVGLAPVAPVMELKSEDKRFIDARSVELAADHSTNLAAMGWDDFEHLVREVFDKEFALRGGEVKVTQSSSDGGVDAVAFDPDPISGGKIVIQAKRYTRTVGVAAVRDLYGTTLNEGASRGILVTTADFGPDAYKFASDKPLTLMGGANLLHLLEKHGIHARIDVKRAREVLGLV